MKFPEVMYGIIKLKNKQYGFRNTCKYDKSIKITQEDSRQQLTWLEGDRKIK